jgi:precorrin-2 dehydrogenase/sirohydrochlorin ferrochelatase
MLDVRDKRIVIVGGGAVALRKATKLVEAGANDVVVVAPQFIAGFPEAVWKVKAAFEPDHLAGAMMVFAATDSSKVNAAVVREARRRRAFVCRADGVAGKGKAAGDFTLPAIMRGGPVTVGVWAQSPALAARIREGVSQRWDARWTIMAEAMTTLRPMIVKSGLPPAMRRDLLRELSGEAAMEKLAMATVKDKDEAIRELGRWIESRIHEHKRTQRD